MTTEFIEKENKDFLIKEPICFNIRKTKIKMVLGTYLYSLIKVGSVTAKIFLIWTYVTRTNVAWTNVTVTVGIC